MELSRLKSKMRRGDLVLINEMIQKKVTYTYVRMMFCGMRPLRKDVIEAAEQIIESREKLLAGKKHPKSGN